MGQVRVAWVPYAVLGPTLAGLIPLLSCGDAPATPVPRPRVECTPGAAGIVGGLALPIPGVSFPPACRIAEDDSPMAVVRRSVSVIETEAQLEAACRLPDPSLIAGLVDFSRDRLFLVRVPDTTTPRWAVATSSVVTVGESTTECTGVTPKAIRYAIKVPVTSTIAFFLCDPLGCEEDPSG